jgi:hypothetical protein
MAFDAVKGREAQSKKEMKPQRAHLTLCIAGEYVPVVFDLDKNMVTTPEFPTIPIDFTARCGHRISQENLVLICHNKTKTN